MLRAGCCELVTERKRHYLRTFLFIFSRLSKLKKSKTYESTFGRTASIKSHAKESRDRRSACMNPIAGSNPTLRAAIRDSDF